MEHLLDTDILIDFLRGKPEARAWMEALSQAPGVAVFTALVTEAPYIRVVG